MEPFAALSDPTRRQIIELLGRGEQPAGAITRRFSLSAPAISQHLKALKAARLVRSRVDGQRRIYSLDPNGFGEIEGWMARVRRYWTGRLDDLERELNKPQKEDPT
jgi:DNA-binding transcriptional ArsR family regulator